MTPSKVTILSSTWEGMRGCSAPARAAESSSSSSEGRQERTAHREGNAEMLMGREAIK